MTCIVGIQHDGDVWLGGDSAGVAAGHYLSSRADEKVFRCEGYLYAICGSFRGGNVLRYSFKPPRLFENDDLVEYMNTRYIDALRQAMGNAGQRMVHEGLESTDNFAFLVGVRGRLFCVESDFQVGYSRSDYLADGSGVSVAEGVLHATRTMNLNPEERLKLALEAAEAHVTSVRGPFVIERLGASS